MIIRLFIFSSFCVMVMCVTIPSYASASYTLAECTSLEEREGVEHPTAVEYCESKGNVPEKQIIKQNISEINSAGLGVAVAVVGGVTLLLGAVIMIHKGIVFIKRFA